MTLLSPKGLLEFLLPSIKAAFEVESITTDDLLEYSAEIEHFISDLQYTNLIIRKADKIIIQATFDFSNGAVILCQKSNIVLTEQNYRAYVSIICLPKGQVFQYLHSSISSYFMPYIRNVVPAQDALSQNVIETLLDFDIAISRYQQKSNLPEPKMETETELAAAAASGQMTPSQTSVFLSQVDQWENTVTSILSYAKSPPTFERLSEELSYWSLLSQRLEEVSAQSKAMKTKGLMPFITKNRNHFDKFYNSVIEDITTLKPVIIFANALNGISDYVSKIEYCDTLDDLKIIITEIYTSLSSFFATCSYRSRSPVIYSLIQKTIIDKIVSILAMMEIVHLPLESFTAAMKSIDSLFEKWCVDESNMLEALSSNSVPSVTTTPVHEHELFKRLETFRDIKTDYHLLSTHLNDNPKLDAEYVKVSIEQAFNGISSQPILDMSQRACSMWSSAVSEYKQTIAKIDIDLTQIIVRLLKKDSSLQGTQSTFVKHAVICSRPSVHRELKEIQQRFVGQIMELLEQFSKRELERIDRLPIIDFMVERGTPDSIAKYLHIQHIGHKLDTVNQMLCDVVGSKWLEHYPILRDIFNRCRELITKNTNMRKLSEPFKTILNVMEKPIFEISPQKELRCSFGNTTAKNIATFRSLQHLGKNDYTELIRDMTIAYEAYNSSVRVAEGIEMFAGTIKSMDEILLNISADEIQAGYLLIKEGWSYHWNDSNTKKFAKEFARHSYNFFHFVKKAKSHMESIDRALHEIENGEPGQSVVRALDTIREEVGLIFIGRSSNYWMYLADINDRLIEAIVLKVETLLEQWINALEKREAGPYSDRISINITLKDGRISIEPPVAAVENLIINTISEQANSYLLQPKVTFGEDDDDGLFRDAIPIDGEQMFRIYKQVKAICAEVKEETSIWNKVDVLFAARPEQFNVEMSVIEWTELVATLDELSHTIAKTPDHKMVACISINSRRAREAALKKIGDWMRFARAKLHNSARDAISDMLKSISDRSLDLDRPLPTSARELSSFLRGFKESSDCQLNWASHFSTFEEASKFTSIDELPKFTQAIDDFAQVIERRRKDIDEQKPKLRELVAKESEAMLSSIETIKTKWNKDKPLNGDVEPEKALSILSQYRKVFEKARADWDVVCGAMELLGLEYTDSATLSYITEELNNMEEVWVLLSKIWTRLKGHFEEPFETFQPPALKSKVLSMLEELQAMSNTVRQYEAWSYFNKKLRTILKIFPTLEGLKSQAVLPRHWAQLSQHFGIQFDPQTSSVGAVIDLDPIKNESFFGELLRSAQGEFSLHQYLEMLDQTWNSLEFEFSLYKDKLSLIKNAPMILTTISDHLNFLNTMQTSPFFHVFRDQATQWENTLNRLQVILDDWLDVQRRFVYLEGVFCSPDIRSILVKATGNFRRAEKEFLTLTKRSVQLRLVMKITAIPNVGSTLTALNENLLALQKELSDYLEKQRSLFPRFFFIGDEDLLEIIGKSSAIGDIQRHFGKMFEGLSVVTIDNNAIVDMSCTEGEVVPFANPVPISSAVHQTLSSMEKEMRNSLKKSLQTAISDFDEFWNNMTVDGLGKIISSYSAQVVLLCFYVQSTAASEKHITKRTTQAAIDELIKFISILSQLVFADLSPVARNCVQQLITEAVHHRNLSRELNNAESIQSFEWTRFLRFYQKPNGDLAANIGDASFLYGFEYLGLCPSLVRTPLTDRVYLTMAQALFAKLGGSPFGPAGTGKTETVKNMGHHLGRLVLVFNCDETFDFKAMGRIFVGLCHCGSWGCFDEFNRLDEQMLSAVSQQIQTIQAGLKANQPVIQILGRKVPLNQDIGIFITMNPGYAGRVELPDNLKQLFRTMAMNRPDTELITEVLLFSQGFASAEQLAPKFVLLFSMAKESLSSQTHYDFGLRAMKSVLTNAGQLIRAANIGNNDRGPAEARLLISSIVNALFPKLLAHDLTKLTRLMDDVFPGVSPQSIEQTELLAAVHEEAAAAGWIDSDIWVQKIIQLFYIQQINHGFMLVGSSATGKTSAWSTLLRVLTKLDKVESESYVINPKSVTKDTLFGCLDPVTREWTDGVFTRILRNIVANQKGEMEKRHWIVFDGDVDPEWVENLNSVLDDNKLLTLPNGERIALPPNVRVVFEVENLNYATPATVSRCGIVYFSQNTLNVKEITHFHLHKLSTEPILTPTHLLYSDFMDMPVPTMLELQSKFAELCRPSIEAALTECLNFWEENSESAAMEIPIASSISTLFSLLSASFVELFRATEPELVMGKVALFASYWAFASPFPQDCRIKLDERLRGKFKNDSPDGPIYEHYINADAEDWAPVSTSSEPVDGFVPTAETELVRRLVQMLSIGGKSVVLCGPVGVGKQTTLNASLSRFADLQTIRLNFSNCSTIDFALQTIEQYCVYVKTSNGTHLKPKASNTFIDFSCNNLNLPALDKYGTQRVVEFLRQFLDLKGFWHPKRREWISLEYISFSGLCSPPSSYGRVKLSSRFLRHAAVVLVEHPRDESVKRIAAAMLHDDSFSYENESSEAIASFYKEFKEHFRASENPHYAANMRDISSWVSALKFALGQGEIPNVAHLLYYEGLRIFGDRLALAEEKKWVETTCQQAVLKAFDDADTQAFQEHSIYTRALTSKYSPSDLEKVTSKLESRFKDFSEETVGNQLVFFDECTEAVCKVERRLAEPGGHLMIAGLSGMGKTTTPAFVAFMLGMPFIRLHVHREYNLAEFDSDLRSVLKTSLSQPTVLHIRESELIRPVFIERLNVLLAESRIPGLFSGDELQNLLADLKDAARADGIRAEGEDDLLDYFAAKVRENLHVVFTVNSAIVNMNERDVMFPSLFTTSEILWLGSWSDASLRAFACAVFKEQEMPEMENLADAMVRIHNASSAASEELPISNYVSPRYFFEFVYRFCTILREKKQKLQTEQLHLNTGLSKLEETQLEVSKMGKDLAVKQNELKEKEQLAEQKLKQIVADTQVTTTKKEEAQRIKVDIEKKRASMKDDQEAAERELAQVAPAIEEARKSVQNINKAKLDEIRRLSQPPDPVKDTLSAVLMLLNIPAPSWAAIRKVISSDTFIRSVLDFSIDSVAGATGKKVKSLIDNSGLTLERANRASQACGPLFRWLQANIRYLEILESTEPLRAKVEAIEKEAALLEKKYNELNKTAIALEHRLTSLTNEYKGLVAQCEQTRHEAESVRVKMDRASHLLTSLTSETKRWGESRSAFQRESDNINGHALLSSACVAYCGFLEQGRRAESIAQWRSELEKDGIKFSNDYDFSGFMTDPATVIEWSQKQLPKDDLCTQNAVILQHKANRTPLIIDPAGQATAFIVATYSNIVRTSFIDPKFPKHLESCLRFGSPILIEEGEQIDPLVFPVLAHEFKRASGRTLLDLKGNEIDVSPAFQMFIVTRDTDYAPTPAIASLTVLVNFSVTSLSLRSQCLSRLLQVKLPDIEKQRQELHQSLASMQVALHGLEEKMLNVFSTTKGEILENDELLHLLEDIKKEAKQIETKANETRTALQKITEVSEQFASVAEVSTSLYFVLRDMSCVHFLYQFSLQFFWNVFDQSSAADAPPNELVELIAKELFVATSYSLLNRHLPVLGFRFGQILIENRGVKVEESLYDLALRGVSLRGAEPKFLELAKPENTDGAAWLQTDAPETNLSPSVQNALNSDHPAITAIKVLAIMRRARPDRIVAATKLFVAAAFGFDVLDIPPLDLLKTAAESSPAVPMLLCASAGHDPSERIESSSPRPVESVAVGAADSYTAIESAVRTAAQRGHWVVIKNVHLAPMWTRDFVKSLASLRPHKETRIFMTSEINPKVGSNVFRSCRVIVFESASGVRANLRRVYSSGIQWPNVPAERRKLALNFMWLHAAVMERLRFEPLGWAKRYEFNDADLRFGMQIGMRWLENTAAGRSHLSAEEFPWSAVRFLLSGCVYGGRVDQPSDQRALRAMAEAMFKPGAVVADGLIETPEVTSMDEFKKWVDELPTDESPEMLWLPKNSGKFLFIQQGNETLQHILGVIAGSASAAASGRTDSFAKLLLSQWREKLEDVALPAPPKPTSLLAEFIADELSQLSSTRSKILSDIATILNAIAAGDALTQYGQRVIDELSRGSVPAEWNRHQYAARDLAQWIADLVARIKHISACATDKNLGRSRYQLGLFASPESLLAAARQTAASEKGWPIERVRLVLDVAAKSMRNSFDLCAMGVTTLCAEWDSEAGALAATDEVTGRLPPTVISFTTEPPAGGVTVACFMTTSKKRVVFETVMPVTGHDETWWAIRNPGLILQPDAI